MVFTVDIGNSNIVIGVIKDREVLFVERVSTDIGATALEYAVIFRSALEMHRIPLDGIDGSIISSVVPPLTVMVNEAILKLTGTEALVVGPGIKTGLHIAIDNPAQLGADMVVGAVAAIDKYPLPQIVIDMGTATTISAIDENGKFLGGTIGPGMRTALDSLVSNTAQLPNIGFEAPPHVIGKNTVDSMKSGVLFGNAAMLDGMIDRIEAELGRPATVIATGGLAQFIIPLCRHEIIYDEQLLLAGLALLYDKNTR